MLIKRQIEHELGGAQKSKSATGNRRTLVVVLTLEERNTFIVVHLRGSA